MKREIKDITELHIGTKIANKMTNEPLNVIGLFAATYPDLDNSHDIVYADFEDNPGDALEFYINDIYIIEDEN